MLHRFDDRLGCGCQCCRRFRCGSRRGIIARRHARRCERRNVLGRRAKLVGIADKIFARRRFGQGPDDIAERQHRSDDHESRVTEEVSEGKNDHGKAADAEHFHLRNAVGRRVHVTAGHGQRGIADEERGEENHEIFQLQPERCSGQRDHAAEQEQRDGRGDERGRNEREDGIDAGPHVRLQEPAQGDVSAIQRGQHASAEKNAIGAEDPRMLRRVGMEQAHHRVVSVNMPTQSGAEKLGATDAQRPEREHAVENEQQEKLQRPDEIRGSHRNAFTVHLDGALPLLQIKPRAEQEADNDRHGETPEIPIVGRESFHGDGRQAIGKAGWRGP